MKIATLMLVSTPYFVTRYSAFVQAFPGCTLHSIELGRSSTTYPWKPQFDRLPYDRWVLTEKAAEQETCITLIRELFRVLNKIQPDAMAIAGYADLTMIAALLWCVWYRKPVVMFSDSKQDDAVRSWWKEFPKRLILKFYSAALVAGKPHREYLSQLGMREDVLFSGYDVIDNDTFHPNRIRALPRPIERPYFLAINRFVAKKNLLNLISAYAQYRSGVSDAWDLVLCGDGEQRSQIEAELDRLELKPYVHLPGFLEQAETLPFFAHASCFVHASIQEQWGLVVNEAMAAALPVLVSNRCGCYQDLIVEGVNGFGFDPENVAQLAALMQRITEVDRDRFGQAALAQIQRFSPSHFAQGLYDAIQAATLSSNIGQPVS